MLDCLMETIQSDILVIGAGIIGLTCAYELGQRGVKVTVIDQYAPGKGCSYGNAGWITPCFAQPLPMPGLWMQSFKWLMNPDSPLYIKPEASWIFIRWMTRFLRSMSQSRAEASIMALARLSQHSLEIWREWANSFQSSCGLENKGLLMVAETDLAMRRARDQMSLMSRHGICGQLLNPEDVRQLEPGVTGSIHGGVYFPDEAHAEPYEVVKAVAEAASKVGVNIVSSTEAFEFITANQQLQAVQTAKAIFAARQFVLATGAWSHALGKKLGVYLPVLGGKGYSLTLSLPVPVLTRPVLLVDRKIALTPRNEGIRVAGTLELVNQDFSVTARRMRAVLSGAKTSIHLPEQAVITEIWRGLRPCTPDGVPIIGYSETCKNLFVTTGHQMLGLQTASGSARLAADLLTGVRPCLDPYPFRVDRF